MKAGGEVRWLEFNDSNVQNNSGTFAFARTETGLTGLNSGNAIASFLLEQVDQGSVGFQTVSAEYPRSRAWNLHVGDTWKLTPKLSLNYGLRWDVFPPSVEKFDNTSFLDPVGPNPGAGNRLGRLAFAGTKWGAASFGRRAPENTWHGGFGPRLGFAYGVTTKTVARAGYGIFYSSIFYPSWNGGISWDGFNTNAAFSSSQGGLQAAFILSQGFPQNFPHPPLIDSAADNGLGSIFYRPFDADRLPYAQQWNLTLEHQFTGNFYVSGAYVANKGTRLNSQTLPINALSPSLLAVGQKLYDQFQPAQTSLDGVPVPYPGWIQQMTACAPTVAQALTPYPQYCSALRGANENLGSSTYHSFQLKAENRFSHGIWFLGAYTASKLLTNADSVQSAATLWSGAHGSISPFERQRNKGLAEDDTPQILSLSLIYQLPFGIGRRFVNRSGGVDKLLGGWQVSSTFRVTSGTPLFFRSAACNVPGQFVAACIPALLPGANPWGQDKGNFEPSLRLFNKAAFESPDGFNFYYGKGPRISNLRGFGYHDHDLAFLKNTRLTEKTSIQFRAEFFNIWNWHISACQAQCFGNLAFDNDVSSPSFGSWNGSVSAPRNIQFGMKILF